MSCPLTVPGQPQRKGVSDRLSAVDGPLRTEALRRPKTPEITEFLK